MNEENLSDQTAVEKKFLQIKSIRTSSNAFLMKLKEEDIIIALDGKEVNQSYDDLSKELNEIKERKVLTLYREGVFFNTFVFGSLGVVCEQIEPENIPELNNFKLNELYRAEEFYHQYELFKKSESIAILLNTSPSILASLAPPLALPSSRRRCRTSTSIRTSRKRTPSTTTGRARPPTSRR